MIRCPAGATTRDARGNRRGRGPRATSASGAGADGKSKWQTCATYKGEWLTTNGKPVKHGFGADDHVAIVVTDGQRIAGVLQAGVQH